jgi:hypothetical protein
MHKKISHSLTQNLITPVNFVLCVLDNINEDIETGNKIKSQEELYTKHSQILTSSVKRIKALIDNYRDLISIQNNSFTIMNQRFNLR